jgi:hypothetical protein
MKKVTEKIYNQPTSDKLDKALTDKANAVFQNAAVTMQREFEEHKVTQEIDGGIGSKNISDTLPGANNAPNNLFSFIGFDSGTRPTDAIRKRLDPNPASKIGPQMTRVGKDTRGSVVRYQFKVSVPFEDIYKETPIPWAKGLSWAEKIETDIPGYSHFLQKYLSTPDPSHSGGGIQIDKEVRSAKFSAPEGGYLKGIFARFTARIRGEIKQ